MASDGVESNRIAGGWIDITNWCMYMHICPDECTPMSIGIDQPPCATPAARPAQTQNPHPKPTTPPRPLQRPTQPQILTTHHTPHRLSNQGATCYLNSLIQTLYMTPEFRRALYMWRYKDDHHKSDKAKAAADGCVALFNIYIYL
jgi:hypothetical protein